MDALVQYLKSRRYVETKGEAGYVLQDHRRMEETQVYLNESNEQLVNVHKYHNAFVEIEDCFQLSFIGLMPESALVLLQCLEKSEWQFHMPRS